MLKNLREQVAASLTRYNMLSPKDRVGVGVSGGADSVVLLHLLHELGFAVVVLHVNHQLRGAESDADEQFVRSLAKSLGLVAEVKQAPIGVGNMEQLARDARRAFFFEMKERLGLRRIALGHTRTDQAETVLYRFLRGSGLAGLSGMLPVSSDGIIRPLLGITREEIRAFATAQSILWREDRSNQDTELVRNRMRLEVFNPQLVRVLSGNALIAQDEEAWWASHIPALFNDLVRQSRFGLEFEVGALADLHPAELRRLIRHAARQLKGDLRSIDASHIEAIKDLTSSEAGHDRVLIPGVDALRSFGVLLLAEPGSLNSRPRHYRLFTEIGKELALPDHGGRLYVNWIKRNNEFCGNFGLEASSIQEVTDLDAEKLERVGKLDELHIRNWEPGDGYRRVGHEKSEKIKSLFQEYRIVLWGRRHWPVLELGEEIVWSPRFGAAAEYKACNDSHFILRLIYGSDAI